ncbi:hypothetical protein EXS71_04005 [Candidatus Uhrbacteria bacterium]|nr:hypothetical protein [Candidatus Uhrbacteria bacterium]
MHFEIKFLPEKTKQYPLRILIYWIIIWASLFLFSTIKILPSISTNGLMIKKTTCLEFASSGRFDEEENCVKYGKSYFVPVGAELLDAFKSIGIYSGVITWLVGLMLMKGKSIQDKKELGKTPP